MLKTRDILPRSMMYYHSLYCLRNRFKIIQFHFSCINIYQFILENFAEPEAPTPFTTITNSLGMLTCN